MGSSQLVVCAFLFACASLSDARPLGLRRPAYWGVDAQKPEEVKARVGAEPERDHSRFFAQPPGRFQSTQQMSRQTAEPLSWSFPRDPVSETKLPLYFELPQPAAAANRVAVLCGESSVQVEVSQDLLGIGQLIKPEEVLLGGCSATEVDVMSHVLTFETPLHGCGSTLVLTEDALVYAFTLVYNPQVLGNTNIVRSRSAVIGVECHYPRKHGVSSQSLNPAWRFYKDAKVSEEQLQFSLRLMTEDWKFERPSNQFTVGDVINMEASVTQYKHVPLRVLVDSCVATLEPDGRTSPTHSFIDNHGCHYDSRLTGSRVQFMPQSQADKLQFQVEASRFHRQKTSSIYITCQLKALPASSPSSMEHKACFYDQRWRRNRWRAVDGSDQFCACCDSSCAMRKVRDLTAEEPLTEITLGPIVVQ